MALYVCLAVVVVAALLFYGPTPVTQACPVAPPMPLRQLYVMSERVVVGRVSQSALLQTEKLGENGEYEKTLLRTSFHVSKTVKGEGPEEEVVHVYQWLWGGREAPEDFAEGKTLLLFLVHRKDEEEGYEVVDESYGAKALSDDALKVYLRRMAELAVIMRDKKPDKARIVEWLVRCAEEPATRWEGAYELFTSQQHLNRETAEKSGETEGAEAEEAAAEDEAESAETVPVEENQIREQEIISLPSSFSRFLNDGLSPYSPEFARLLTAEQKTRLSTAFFGLQNLSDEDMMLFHLVSSWGDERMIPFILSQLEKAKAEPPAYVEQLVTALSEMLQNDKLSALAERYCYNASYRDSDEPEESDDEETDEEEKALTGTCAQKRSVRLQRFLAEAENVMSNRVAMAQ